LTVGRDRVYRCLRMSPKCPGCQRPFLPDDAISFDGDQITHADCHRPHGLTEDERALLFRFCKDHIVAECATCNRGFQQKELASDIIVGRTHLCPSCRADLMEPVRAHLHGCALLPEAVRLRARQVREISRHLIKHAQQLADRADMLMREQEAMLAADRALIWQATISLRALREAMRLAAPGD
jgi:hypothetical protein